MSWNINSVKTKLEKTNVYNIINDYDIVSLNEIKTPLSISCPGYKSITSRDSNNPNRGGTCVLIKNKLSSQVTQVDISKPDQVWLKLKCQPGILFGFIYIPPHDSFYFNEASFSYIQEKNKEESTVSRCIIIGDVNARMGNKVRELPVHLDLRDLSYPTIPDPIANANINGNLIYSICCENKLLIVNNASINSKHFKSSLTYKQGRIWVSELDVCIISPNLVDVVNNFKTIQDMSLPSDHAPISFDLQICIDIDILYERAQSLGDHAICHSSNKVNLCRKPIKYSHIDSNHFLDKLAQCEVPDVNGDICATVENIGNTLYDCASASKTPPIMNRLNDTRLSRWEQLLENNSDKQIWAAINWRGEFNANLSLESSTPTDQQFKDFFDIALTTDDQLSLESIQSDVNIPLLDNHITDVEVCKQLQDMASDRSGGPDGIPPGVLKLLPATWLVLLTALLNKLFFSAVYPQAWVVAKMFTIFKKGNRLLPENYRGITIINCIAKLYDKILCSRLHLWFKPYREQAGSQKGRGCLEQIVTLRLIADYAFRKKIKLYIIFVDFSQAYDKVSRVVLFSILKRLGCGFVMLLALISMYKTTQSIIGTALVTASVGVRQGSPTSCLLFVLFVNDMIKLFKERCGPEGFLNWLHLLVFMDDTVLVSTSRNGAIAKLSLLKEFCLSHGMKVNVSKTKFIVIKGTNEDQEDLVIEDMRVRRCSHYVYLGSPFSDAGSTSDSIKVNANIRMCQALKFVSFCQKNNDIPFWVKKKVFDAALMSSLLYGCESWLNGNIKPMENLYNMCIKHLLGVRKTTNTNLCLVELGLPPLKALVKQRQKKFFKCMWTERRDMNDDPLSFVLHLVKDSRICTRNYIEDLLESESNDVSEGSNKLIQDIISSDSSKCIYYVTINPDMKVHDIYSTKVSLNELERMSWSKLRLSAHSLAIETGRWNRRGRGRLPMDQRLCQCGLVQTERHVVETCTMSQHIRNLHSVRSLENLFLEIEDYSKVCHIAHTILEIYR